MNEAFLERVREVPTPCWVVDEGALRRNVAVMDGVQQRTGAKILLALKAFAMPRVFPLLRETLHGVCASGLLEARLGREAFGREVHVFAPAYSAEDLAELVTLADHLSFNSFAQWRLARPVVEAAGRPIACGLRINPEHSEAEVALYDPCARGSRLGIRAAQFKDEDLSSLTGLHFHTLCEQNADALERTVAAVEKKFGPYLEGMKWLNLGGGHHITRPDYDVDRLCRTIDAVKARYGVEVYLEPGEAHALQAGVLVTQVMDIVHNEVDIAILDTSATAHMPDVLEMPYRPEVVGAGKPGEKAHTYRLGGLTCLAGDVVGDYSFDEPLTPGARVVFLDMAHYTMVKTTMFNGIRLPSIALYHPESDSVEMVRTFGYEAYRDRL